MIRTSFTARLGIDVPIVQAPIGGASSPELVAAVSAAGGLGMFAMTWRPPEQVRNDLLAVRAVTSRPFGVNFVLEWDPAERLAICLDAGVALVSFFWGDSSPWIERCHDAGALVAVTVGSAEEAGRAVDAGADVIVAQGWEASGHVWGDVATMALVPSVVDAAEGRPVLAAGGIADGRGIAAALALGAAGVWMGTRFVASTEAKAHPFWQRRLVDAAETATVHTDLFDVGWPNAHLRAIRNSTFDDWLAAGSPRSGDRPGEQDVTGRYADGRTVMRYADVPPMPGMSGDLEAMVNYAGQGVGLVRSILPAGEIVRRLEADAVAALDRAHAMTGAVTQ